MSISHLFERDSFHFVSNPSTHLDQLDTPQPQNLSFDLRDSQKIYGVIESIIPSSSFAPKNDKTIPLSPAALLTHDVLLELPDPPSAHSVDIPQLVETQSSNSLIGFEEDENEPDTPNLTAWESCTIRAGGRAKSLFDLSKERLQDKTKPPSDELGVLSPHRQEVYNRMASIVVDVNDDTDFDETFEEEFEEDYSFAGNLKVLTLPEFSSSVIIHEYNSPEPSAEDDQYECVDEYSQTSDEEESNTSAGLRHQEEKILEFHEMMRQRIRSRLSQILSDMDQLIDEKRNAFSS